MTDSSGNDFWSRFGFKTPPLNVDVTQEFMRVRDAFIRAGQAIEKDVPEMAEVRDIEVTGGHHSLNARIYTPLAAGFAPGPGLVYFHGGGFVLGDVESFDTVCRRLADSSRCRILFVEYRLAPQHKFPAPIDDALSAFEWAVDNAGEWGVDPARLAVGGDSAGGNLAINVARAGLSGDVSRPAFQLLIYPLTQFATLEGKPTRLKEAPIISPAIFRFFRDAYLPDGQDPMDERISPLFARSFAGLPPAHIVTAGWDPLRDEGRVYAEKLNAAGVEATVREYANQPHGFFQTTPVSIPAQEAIADAGKVLARALTAIEA